MVRWWSRGHKQSNESCLLLLSLKVTNEKRYYVLLIITLNRFVSVKVGFSNSLWPKMWHEGLNASNINGTGECCLNH